MIHNGQVLTHNKYNWYSIRIIKKIPYRNKYVCVELGMGKPENECVLSKKELLKNYH